MDATLTGKRPGLSFADLIAPLTPDAFFRDTLGQQWRHIPGAAANTNLH